MAEYRGEGRDDPRPDEEPGCGCRIEVDTRLGKWGQHVIVYCLLHASAPELFKALAARVDHADDCVGHAACAAYPAADFMKGRALVARLREIGR